MSIDRARRLSALARAMHDDSALAPGGVDLATYRIEAAEPGALASHLTERFERMAAAGAAAPLVRPAVERLFDCEELIRTLRRAMIKRDPAPTVEQYETAINGAIALLVAARVLGRDPDAEVAAIPATGGRS